MARDERQRVSRLLASAHGHLAGVRSMLDEGADCPEVVYQLRAVRKSLERIERELAEEHLRGCLVHDPELARSIIRLWQYSPGRPGQ